MYIVNAAAVVDLTTQGATALADKVTGLYSPGIFQAQHLKGFCFKSYFLSTLNVFLVRFRVQQGSLSLTRINNHITCKVWDDIIYPLPKSLGMNK